MLISYRYAYVFFLFNDVVSGARRGAKPFPWARSRNLEKNEIKITARMQFCALGMVLSRRPLSRFACLGSRHCLGAPSHDSRASGESLAGLSQHSITIYSREMDIICKSEIRVPLVTFGESTALPRNLISIYIRIVFLACKSSWIFLCFFACFIPYSPIKNYRDIFRYLRTHECRD